MIGNFSNQNPKGRDGTSITVLSIQEPANESPDREYSRVSFIVLQLSLLVEQSLKMLVFLQNHMEFIRWKFVMCLERNMTINVSNL